MFVRVRNPGRVWKRFLPLLLLPALSPQRYGFSAFAFTGQRHFQAITTSSLPRERRNEHHSDLREHVVDLFSSFQGGNSDVLSLSDRFVANMTIFNSFVQKNFFLLGMVIAVFLAKTLPSVS